MSPVVDHLVVRLQQPLNPVEDEPQRRRITECFWHHFVAKGPVRSARGVRTGILGKKRGRLRKLDEELAFDVVARKPHPTTLLRCPRHER